MGNKMPLESGNGFRTPGEPTARVWHKGNDPIRRRFIAMIIVDVDLISNAISLLDGCI